MQADIDIFVRMIMPLVYFQTKDVKDQLIHYRAHVLQLLVIHGEFVMLCRQQNIHVLVTLVSCLQTALIEMNVLWC